MEFSKPTYTPIIKSTDAELKGYNNLSGDIKKSILPVFELTRSRRSKYSPEGNIHKRMDFIGEMVKSSPFILDLTSHEDLTNSQIEDLLDETAGFKNWQEFLDEYRQLNIVPAIHLYEDTPEQVLQLEVRNLLSKHEKLALRVEASDGDLNSYLSTIRDVLDSDSQLILIIDYGYVEQKKYSFSYADIKERLEGLPSNFSPWAISICGSSFPPSVTSLQNCYDDHGTIPLLEKQMHNQILQDFEFVTYGDFGSVHPVRYNTRGGGWVPRVDFPLGNSIIYTRYRRNDGGYIQAAKAMIEDPKYSDIRAWGNREIEAAANENPNGLSPAHWISVRVNIHLSRQANLVTK